MTTKEDIKTRARINAIGNGALGGPMGNAGTGTGFNASMGADTSQDATNSMGSITADTQSCMPMEVSEESYQFTAKQTPVSAPGRMGAMSLGD